MTAGQDRFPKMVILALQEWWTRAGQLAWLLSGLLLLASLAGAVILLRWLWRDYRAPKPTMMGGAAHGLSCGEFRARCMKPARMCEPPRQRHSSTHRGSQPPLRAYIEEHYTSG